METLLCLLQANFGMPCSTTETSKSFTSSPDVSTTTGNTASLAYTKSTSYQIASTTCRSVEQFLSEDQKLAIVVFAALVSIVLVVFFIYFLVTRLSKNPSRNLSTLVYDEFQCSLIQIEPDDEDEPMVAIV